MTEHFNPIGNITRLMDEVMVELKPGKRWSYWMPLIKAARREHNRNEAAFDDQNRELEIALEVMTPEQRTEYRNRTYPTLHPREPEDAEFGTVGEALCNATRERKS
jgi:hypothetical protein